MDNLGICNICVDYVLGEIEDELLKKRFERHLSECAKCQHDVMEYRSYIESIESSTIISQDATTAGLQWMTQSNVIQFPGHPAASRQNMRLHPRRHSWSALTISLAMLIISAIGGFETHPGTHIRAFRSSWHHLTQASRFVVAKSDVFVDKLHISRATEPDRKK